MENNMILKLSNKQKTSRNLKIEQNSQNQIQTQLVESQRINLKEEQKQSPELILNSPINHKPPEPQPEIKSNEKIYNDKYGVPAIQNADEKINKIEGTNIENNEVPNNKILENLWVYSIDVKCPNCNTFIRTNVEYNFNCLTVFLFIIMLIFFPLMCCSLFCRNNVGQTQCACHKDYNGKFCYCCHDAQHICPKCKKILGESYSCERLCSCV